jgi:hypothetical protein
VGKWRTSFCFGKLNLRLSAVRFSAGSGTKCLNLNLHLWVWSSPLPNLNHEVRVQFGCEPSAPEVQVLIWANYGNRSQNIFPSGCPNLWFTCGSGLHPVQEVRELDCGQSKIDDVQGFYAKKFETKNVMTKKTIRMDKTQHIEQ